MTVREINRLKDCGFKLTPQRKVIWEAMEDLSGHVTPQQLYDALSVNHPEIGLVTVYRTLSLFKDVGLICEIDCGDGLFHYTMHDCHDADNEEFEHHHHHHLICTECSSVIELDEIPDIDRITSDLESASGFAITSHKLDFFGVCSDCLKRKAVK